MATSEADSSMTTFVDKKKFFEREIAEQTSIQGKPKQERKFSFLQEHEVALLKKEEAKKASYMSESDVLQSVIDNSDTTDFSVMISSVTSRSRNTCASSKSATERLFGRLPPPQVPPKRCLDRNEHSIQNRNSLPSSFLESLPLEHGQQ